MHTINRYVNKSYLIKIDYFLFQSKLNCTGFLVVVSFIIGRLARQFLRARVRSYVCGYMACGGEYCDVADIVDVND